MSCLVLLDKLEQSINNYFKHFANTDAHYYPIKLMEECGEVAEAYVAHVFGSKKKIKKIAQKGQSPRDALIEEIADVVFVAELIALSQGISQEEIAKAIISKASKRASEKIKSLVKEGENVPEI